ncbi:MAG: lytic transglycosylase domain-containing protein, partial [Proteobacteria bacterium]|nr:lytic transglycosylase domain-containing protein [Pseudomonadota bacterium]
VQPQTLNIPGPQNYESDPFNPTVARDAWLLISNAESANNIPAGLLHAISLVESGQGIRGWVLPWPFTVGVNSPGSHTFTTAASAQAAFTRWRTLGFVRFNVRTASGGLKNNLTATQTAQILQTLPTAALTVIEPRSYGRRFNNVTEAESFAHRMMSQGHNNLDIGMMQVNWRVHGKHFRNVRAALEPTANLAYATNYLLTHKQKYDWWGAVGRYHSGTARYANKYIKNVYAMYLRIHRANRNA